MSFEDYSVFDKMIVEVGGFDSYLFVLYSNTIFFDFAKC